MGQNKSIVVITGVSRKEGIGFGLAKAMAGRGFQVVISARDAKAASQLATEISSDDTLVRSHPLDITSEESVKHFQEFMEEEYGAVDVLINNAGGHFDFMVQPLEADFDQVRNAFDTNLFGTWRMIKYMYPLLKRSPHPRIVNVSSGAGSFTHPQFGLGVHPAFVTGYGLSKLALNGLTVQLARQLKKDGILINSLNPGFVATAEGMEAMGARTVEASVDGIIWAATLPDNGPTGLFFEDKKPLNW